MSSEIIVVLALVAVAVAGVVWLELKSRRNGRAGKPSHPRESGD